MKGHTLGAASVSFRLVFCVPLKAFARGRWLLGILALLPIAAQAKVIHLSPNGDDANDGTTAPILSLSAAQKVIERSAPADTEIRIGPGIYHGQSVVWSYTMPGHTIRFIGSPGSVFDGDGKGLTFFLLAGAKGEPTNLTFEGLTVTHYATAISFKGDRNDLSKFNGRNRIVGNRFIDNGGDTRNGLDSTAIVAFVNSDYNVIESNLFKGMISKNCRVLHALYFAHGSSGNLIERNIFENGCGDPVRFRDASNDNTVRDNKFVKVGATAAISEWFCVGRRCTKKTQECPSIGNVIGDNVIGDRYDGKRLKQRDAERHAAPSGCGSDSKP